MADPITLSLVGAGIGMAGSGISTVTNYQNARAQADAEKINAREAELSATQAGLAASANEDAQRRQARALMGEQAAATGEAGLAMAGSAKDIARQSALYAELDALNLRYEGEMKKRGFKWEAIQAKFRAKQAKKAATLSLIGGGLQMGGQAASGYASASYMGEQRAFMKSQQNSLVKS